MPKRRHWFTYQIYPNGRGVPSTHEVLNTVRMTVEAKLRNLTRPYKWFTLLMKSERVMFGAKVEDGARIKEEIETELKQEYPDMYIGFGDEDPDNCELMAIATQCRTKLEDKVPLAKWKAGQIGYIIHCMLNPYGFDDEAWTYWTSLCCIDEDKEVTDQDTKDVISLVRSFLEYKMGTEIEDDYEKVEHILKELDTFTKYLKRKVA
jgi:hypothetical protein